jgi:hypothetical protein
MYCNDFPVMALSKINKQLQISSIKNRPTWWSSHTIYNNWYQERARGCWKKSSCGIRSTQQCKVKNSKIKNKKRLKGRYIFIKCFSLKSLSYSLYFMRVNNVELQLIQIHLNLNRNCILPTKPVDRFWC